VLRRIFGLRRDEVTAGWRKLHNDDLRNLYSSPSGGDIETELTLLRIGKREELL
jgi:hypothetical protein